MRTPFGNLFAAPVVIVVQVHHQSGDGQILVAAGGTVPRRVLERIEQPPDARMKSANVARQREDAFIGGAESIGPAVLAEILAEGLDRPCAKLHLY